MKNKNIVIAIVVAVIVGVIFYGLWTKQKPAGNSSPVKIGVILPLTGDLAVTGEKIFNGFKIAEQELAGKNIQFIVEDSHSKPSDAVSAASKLLNVDGVGLLIGTYSPDETLAVASLAKDKGEDVFSFSFCSDSFKKYDNVFCAYPDASHQLDTVVPVVKERGVKTMALVNQNSDFGLNSRDAMRAKTSVGGYAIALDELVSGGQNDYRTVAAKVIASKAQSVFTATDNPTDALKFTSELYQLGFKGTRITFVDVDNKNLKQFGKSVDGTLAPGIAPSQFSSVFSEAYKQKFGSDPDYTSALGYDITRYVVGALIAKNQVLDYKYPDPAIAGFRFLPDRTVMYQLELQVAKDGEYMKYEK